MSSNYKSEHSWRRQEAVVTQFSWEVSESGSEVEAGRTVTCQEKGEITTDRIHSNLGE